MTQLLIQGEVILAKDVVEVGDEIRSSDQIIPKHVVEGWQIVSADLPDGFRCADYVWQGELVKKPEPVVPKTREQLKAERAAAVAAIKVTTTSGKTFDGDEDSQARMARAVLIAQATGLTETTWTLADNSIVTVTLPELTEALALAGQQQAALWPIPADAP